MMDDEWQKLNDNLRRMKEQEEGMFAEIKKDSDDTITEECKQESKINHAVDKKVSESNIGSEMTNRCV